jgi:UDP-N-acetylglucosamine 2-epimerase (non-hydrolysing)
VEEATALLDDPARYAAMAGAPNPFGDGRSSAKILTALADWWAARHRA